MQGHHHTIWAFQHFQVLNIDDLKREAGWRWKIDSGRQLDIGFFWGKNPCWKRVCNLCNFPSSNQIRPASFATWKQSSMLFFKLFRKKAISRVSLGATKTRGPFVFMVRCSSCKENYFKRERRREGFSNGKLSYDQPDDQLTEIRSSPPVVMYMKVYINKVFNWEFRNHQQDWPPTGEEGFFPGVTNTLPQKILGQPGLLGNSTTHFVILWPARVWQKTSIWQLFQLV